VVVERVSVVDLRCQVVCGSSFSRHTFFDEELEVAFDKISHTKTILNTLVFYHRREWAVRGAGGVGG
jgi:hypothetical protein